MILGDCLCTLHPLWWGGALGQWISKCFQQRAQWKVAREPKLGEFKDQLLTLRLPFMPHLFVTQNSELAYQSGFELSSNLSSNRAWTNNWPFQYLCLFPIFFSSQTDTHTSAGWQKALRILFDFYPFPQNWVAMAAIVVWRQCDVTTSGFWKANWQEEGCLYFWDYIWTNNKEEVRL